MPLKLIQRPDRTLLLSFVEQSKQILQFNVKRHGPLPGNENTTLPNNHPTIQACAQFAIPLLEDYANGILDNSGLKAARNTKYQAAGIPASHSGPNQAGIIKKKPSCQPEPKSDEVATSSTDADAIDNSGNVGGAGEYKPIPLHPVGMMSDAWFS